MKTLISNGRTNGSTKKLKAVIVSTLGKKYKVSYEIALKFEPLLQEARFNSVKQKWIAQAPQRFLF